MSEAPAPLLFILDMATTGRNPKADAIVELAAVAVQDGAIISEWESLVYPGRERLQASHLEYLAGSWFDHTVFELLDLQTPPTITARQQFITWLFNVAGVKPPGPGDEWAQLSDRRFREAWRTAKPSTRLTNAGAPEPLAPRQLLRLASADAELHASFLERLPWELSGFTARMACAYTSWVACIGTYVAYRLTGKDDAGPVSLDAGLAGLEHPLLPAGKHSALTRCRAAAAVAAMLGIV